MLVVELGRRTRRLGVNQSPGSIGIEPHHPIPDHLKPDTADPRRIRARAALVNLSQREATATLCRILRRLGYFPQTRPIKIFPQRNRYSHDEPPWLFVTLIQTFARLGIPHVSRNLRRLVLAELYQRRKL